MTIKKRIFLTNSLMVLLSLVVLLLIVGGMVSLFKDEFLGWYRDNSQISAYYGTVYDRTPEFINSTTDWEELSAALEKYDYRLLVTDEKQQTVYQSARYCEEESAETLYSVEKQPEEVQGYFIENTTIITCRHKIGNDDYEYYIVNCPSGVSIMGMDRGMFEMFLLILLTVGVIAIFVILFLSQFMTKWLTKKILKPVNELDLAAWRVIDGNLDTPIGYDAEDEFKNTCESFDLMQQHLKAEMEKNHAYEVARTEMVSGISHDLRTPLTSVKGYIKGMLDGIANTEEKRQDYLKIAYRKACDMDRLLSRLFYFSKLETGNMPFYFHKTDLRQYLSDYVEEKAAELHEKDADICVIFETDAPVWCNIDREQLQRVLDNLTENACKYARTDKMLEIKISLKEAEEKNAAGFQIDFSDNGEGVKEETLEKIFEQFYREDESRSSEGNGLGLYVCKYILEEHGGSICAYNNNGLHIVMTLPKIKGEVADGENIAGGR